MNKSKRIIKEAMENVNDNDDEKKKDEKDFEDESEDLFDDEDAEESSIVSSVGYTLGSITGLISMLFIASIYISAFEDLSTPLCKTKGQYNQKIPCNMWLRHRTDEEPYMVEQNKFEQLKNKITYPVKMAMVYSKLYEEEPNPNINWFFRKTYDPIGDYSADVLIESWAWNRELFYKIIVAFAGIYGLKDRIDSQDKNSSSLREIFSNIGKLVVGYAWINIVPMTITAISLIAPVSGVIGLATKAISANFIVRSFFFYVLLVWLLPSIVVYFLQYFHNQGLIYFSAYKKRFSKYGPLDTFMYLIKKYRLLVYMNVIISGITIATQGNHNFGISMLLVLIPLYIVKQIMTDTTSKAPEWMFSNSFTSFFAGLYEYNNEQSFRKHDSYNIFKWRLKDMYTNTTNDQGNTRETIITQSIFGYGLLQKLISNLIEVNENPKCDDTSDILKTLMKT